jgi:hypothetical protein
MPVDDGAKTLPAPSFATSFALPLSLISRFKSSTWSSWHLLTSKMASSIVVKGEARESVDVGIAQGVIESIERRRWHRASSSGHQSNDLPGRPNLRSTTAKQNHQCLICAWRTECFNLTRIDFTNLYLNNYILTAVF